MALPTQVVVLAAGQSRRMVPFNSASNKAQLQLMGRPILGWTLRALAATGIEQVVVVINQQMQLSESFWAEWRETFSNVEVVIQTELNGQAGALAAAMPQLAEEFLVINANHVTADEFVPLLAEQVTPVGFLSAPTTHPENYGLVEFDTSTGLVSTVVEKPTQGVGKPAHRLVGVYRLTKAFVQDLTRGVLNDTSLEVTLTAWAKRGLVSTNVVSTEPPTLKYAWHLLDCKQYLWPKLDYHIDQTAIIAPTALIRGEVCIGPGAVIGDYAIIEGPAYIGQHAVVGQYCVVRKGSVLEAGAQIQRHGDVANSILMADAHVHSGFIGDSIIGERTSIGAGFVTANRRMDRQEIVVRLHDTKIITNKTYLGAMIGNDVRIGIQVGTMPNVLVAAQSTIAPGTIVRNNVGV
jgi:UDP-N-acetylglucosamine diphosphorylase / glucose-1-phosphate thymidylyltransferase / UDP-N-acetylgalactosamine diphosphorylase / glucosamine-1-phosphate N-acetyltransferase / galactosamine-1-phosphate N-acetyltransferase